MKMKMKMKMSAVFGLAAVAMASAVAAPAFGQALTGPSTVINPQAGTPPANCKTSSSSQCADSYQFAPNTGTSNTTVTEKPTSYTFADTFNQTNATSTFSDFGKGVYSTTSCDKNPNCLTSNPLLTWNFQDNYDFTTPTSGPRVQGAVLSFSIPGFGVGLANVEARIVAFSSGQAAGQLVSSDPNQITTVDGWQSVKTGGPVDIYTATLNSTPLAANTEYVLEVRGEALSAASYTGSVTFTPVPVPPALVLLASSLLGLLGVAFATGRRPLRYRPMTLMASAI
jgi:hypothetical protein